MQQLMTQFGWTTPFRPMNAKDSGKKKDDLLENDDYIAEEKFDGARYFTVDDRVFSRKLSVKNNLPVERTGNVPHLTRTLQRLPKGSILDGEIYYPGESANRVTTVMGASPAVAVARQALNPVSYMLYDIPYYNGKDLTGLPWKERREFLQKIFNFHFADNPHVHLSTVHRGTEAKKRLLNDVFAKGGEGIMLKNIHAPYHPDARPNDVWFKVKKQDTEDVVITGFEQGKGKYRGMVGAVVFSMYTPEGKLVPLGKTSGMTDTMRLHMTQQPNEYLGKVMEIKFLERTDDGHFRHPNFIRMRPDKNPQDCIWE
jgi:ATP-dependent DNA ligase